MTAVPELPDEVLEMLADFTPKQVKALQEVADQEASNWPSRRDVLKASAIAGGAGTAGAVMSNEGVSQAKAAASTSDGDGDVGTPSSPVDVFADGVDAVSVGAEQLQYALGNTGFSGRLSDRPLVTESATTLTVGTDTATIQEALNQIPFVIRHNFEISVPDGTYNENLLVPPFLVADSAGLNRDDTTNEGASHLPRITGNISTPANCKVDSITVTGTQGAIAPLIEGFNVLDYAPHADELAAVEIYGCQNVSFRWMSFANNTTARVGFLPYSSGVTIRQECDLGSGNLTYGVETKHNANVTIDSFDTASYGLTGSATDYALFNNDGSVVTLGPDDFQATGGIKDIYNREGPLYDATYQEYGPVVGCRAESTVADQSIASATVTTVQFDTTAFDRNGDWDTANYKFVAPEAGRYSIQAQVQWLSPADTTEMRMQAYNNTTTSAIASSRLNGSVHTNPTQQVASTAVLSEGDEVMLRVEHNEGSSVNINTDNPPLTHMEINRLT